MKLSLIGAGGFRTPLVYRALLHDHEEGRVNEVRLFDTSEHRLNSMMKVLTKQAEGIPDAPRLIPCRDLASAVDGTDFIFSAIRVGGLKGRALDERIGLDLGVIGQETVGAGGISYALRTIPVALAMAKTIRHRAPHAWTINFTNPAGVITQAMARELGDRVIGICDSPVGLARHVLEAAHAKPGANVDIDYLGLNHLGWLRSLSVDGQDILPAVLADAALIETFEEGKLFGADWIQTLGAVPNEYLYYYYYTREQLLADRASKSPRGAYLEKQQTDFYDCFHHDVGDPFALWEKTRLDREETYMATNRESAGGFERAETDLESGGYDRVALALMRAIARDEKAQLILNVPNRGIIADLDDSDIIEVPCIVDREGPHARRVPDLPDYARPLVIGVKNVEHYEIEAATSRSRTAALRAFAEHPLVDSVNVARLLLDEYTQQIPELEYLR